MAKRKVLFRVSFVKYSRFMDSRNCKFTKNKIALQSVVYYERINYQVFPI